MDVRCERCGTEYDFDDALVSERGTTVKCTNCNHQFKVFPAHPSGIGPERWIVQTAAGEELTFTTLRDLQKGIAEGKVGPADHLSRGGRPPRALSSIAELEPFFGTRGSKSAGGGRTLTGVAPPQDAEPYFPPPSNRPSSPPQERKRGTTSPLLPYEPSLYESRRHEASDPPTRRRQGEGEPVGAQADEGTRDPVATSEPPSRAGSDLLARSGTFDSTARTEADAKTPQPEAPEGREQVDATLQSAPAGEPASEGAPDAAPHPHIRHTSTAPASTPLGVAPAEPIEAPPDSDRGPREPFFTPSPREQFLSASFSDPDPRYIPLASQRARSRWIVGFIIVGMLVLLAGTVGMGYLKRFVTTAPNEVATTDPRIVEFVANGRRLLSDGDLDGAAEQLSKASLLAERDPAVLAGRAEIEVVRADFLWFELRLLDPAAEDRVATTRRQLGGKVKRAQQAVDALVAVAPEGVAVARLRVDVLRLAGNVEEARQHVGALAGNASDPANAYVLATLDIAEAEPAYKSAVERLRAATAAEEGLGRARAALIYALAQSGDVDAARSELDALSRANAAHHLLADLGAFLNRMRERQRVPTLDSGRVVLDAGSWPRAHDAGSSTGADDFRSRLVQANAALRSGHMGRAERLYRSVLDDQPGNIEALAGLAEVARARKDPNAGMMYDDVLARNPSYLPALMARADQKWDAGERVGAVEIYRRILSQAGPDTAYGRHAQARIAQGSAGSTPAPGVTSTPPSARFDAPPGSGPPLNDATDLPGSDQ